MPYDAPATKRVLTLNGWKDVPVTAPRGDAGTQLRQALGLPEPNYGPGYQNPAYFGGYRSLEDLEDAKAFEAKWKGRA